MIELVRALAATLAVAAASWLASPSAPAAGSGPGPTPPEPDAAPAKVLTRDDHDPEFKKPIEVKVDDVVAVRLPVKLSTGYTWKPRNGRGAKLKAIDKGRRVEGPDGGLLGGEELVEYRFRAESAGTVDLDLRKVRAFDDQPSTAGFREFRAKFRIAPRED